MEEACAKLQYTCLGTLYMNNWWLPEKHLCLEGDESHYSDISCKPEKMCKLKIRVIWNIITTFSSSILPTVLHFSHWHCAAPFSGKGDEREDLLDVS